MAKNCPICNLSEKPILSSPFHLHRHDFILGAICLRTQPIASHLIHCDFLEVERGIYAPGSLLTDDFQISDPFPASLGKEQCKVRNHGDSTTSYSQITGTHNGDLDLTPMGMSLIPATSKSITLPPEHAVFRIVGGKVAVMEVHGSEGDGILGLLQQLGVDMPG